jgi:group I intron endonuclease
MKNQIYKIVNLVNGKFYIGLSVNGGMKRYWKHMSEARCGSPFPIHKAIRKWGERNFELYIFHTLEEGKDPKELYDLEKHYIALHKSNDKFIGYNLTAGGDGTIGRLHSDKTKDKIRQRAIGRKASEETKAKMKASGLQKTSSGKTANRPIKAFKNGIYLGEYNSMTQASADLNVSVEGIRGYFDKCWKQIKGYTFEKINKNEENFHVVDN